MYCWGYNSVLQHISCVQQWISEHCTSNPGTKVSKLSKVLVEATCCVQIEVLDSVKDNRWLKEMLECFHAGDLHRYDELCTKHKSVLNNQPALTENVHQLRQKITVLCLMELIFRYKSQDL